MPDQTIADRLFRYVSGGQDLKPSPDVIIEGGTIGPVTAASVVTTTTQQFVSQEQIARWEAGSRIVPVTITIPTPISGTVRKYHGLGTRLVTTQVLREDGGQEFNVTAKPDPNIDDSIGANNIQIIVPEGETYTGRIIVQSYLPPVVTS